MMHPSAPTASALLWATFIVYWSAAAKSSAPTASAESRESRQRHQLLMWGALLLALVIRPGPLAMRWLPQTSALVVGGFVIQVASFALAVWARKHLGRNWSGAITAKTGHYLVRSGPYARLRHPIYAAMLGMFLGTALVSGELHALIGLALMAAAYHRKIRLEEQHLRRLFGSEYADYERRSWTLVPRVF